MEQELDALVEKWRRNINDPTDKATYAVKQCALEWAKEEQSKSPIKQICEQQVVIHDIEADRDQWKARAEKVESEINKCLPVLADIKLELSKLKERL